MKLIKCVNSFLIGFYLAYIICLCIMGYVMSKHFVSKSVLEVDRLYIDGKFYEAKK